MRRNKKEEYLNSHHTGNNPTNFPVDEGQTWTWRKSAVHRSRIVIHEPLIPSPLEPRDTSMIQPGYVQQRSQNNQWVCTIHVLHTETTGRQQTPDDEKNGPWHEQCHCEDEGFVRWWGVRRDELDVRKLIVVPVDFVVPYNGCDGCALRDLFHHVRHFVVVVVVVVVGIVGVFKSLLLNN